MTLSVVLDRLRERAESDPALLETLQHLVDSEPVVDPFGTPAEDVTELARTLNEQRQADRLSQLRARSLTSGQVVEMVPSISDRKGVDRRRARGTLLGIRIGNQMLHPSWQFDPRRGDTLAGLRRVLAALAEVVSDGLDADAIAIMPRAEADGASVADLLADGHIDAAVALAQLAGDQS
ncbi:MAG: hypothetical protein EA388_00535 [Nitriliruptor sp.]|nr:MAG: hypothetical protein EA388_00535 [Nitriliruptor sp.]